MSIWNKLVSGFKVAKFGGAISNTPRIVTVTTETTVDESYNGGTITCATDGLVHILADSCPVGMKVKFINSAVTTTAILAIKGSATVGIGGRNQVIAGVSKILTSAVGKELRNTKATALAYDYVELEKVSATAWDAVTHGIWAKEA